MVSFLLFSQVPCFPLSCVTVRHSVVSDSLRPHEVELSRPLCPWGSPGKNTGWGCHSLAQGILPAERLYPALLHCRNVLYCLNYNKCHREVLSLLFQHEFLCGVFFSLHRAACRTLVP